MTEAQSKDVAELHRLAESSDERANKASAGTAYRNHHAGRAAAYRDAIRLLTYGPAFVTLDSE